MGTFSDFFRPHATILTLIVAFSCALFLVHPQHKQGNYKWAVSKMTGLENAKMWKRGQLKLAVNSIDDNGLTLLYAFSFLFEATDHLDLKLEEIEKRQGDPLLFRLFMLSSYVLFFACLYMSLAKLFSPLLGVGMVVLYWAHNLFNFTTFSGNVYGLTLYGLVSVLIFLCALKEQNRSVAILSFVLLVVYYLFRSLNFLYVFPLLGLFLLPSWRKILGVDEKRRFWVAIFVAAFMVVKISLGAILPGHPTWHAFYTGLMEFGGRIDRHDYRIYPVDLGYPSTLVDYEEVEDWSDSYSIRYGESVFEGASYPNKLYNRALQEDLIRIFISRPSLLVILPLKRLWNTLIFIPWQDWPTPPLPMTASSTFNRCYRVVFCVLVLLYLVFFACKKHLLIYFFILPGLLPSLLVYSKNMLFNLSGHFLFYLILGQLMLEIMDRALKRQKRAL